LNKPNEEIIVNSTIESTEDKEILPSSLKEDKLKINNLNETKIKKTRNIFSQVNEENKLEEKLSN